MSWTWISVIWLLVSVCAGILVGRSILIAERDAPPVAAGSEPHAGPEAGCDPSPVPEGEVTPADVPALPAGGRRRRIGRKRTRSTVSGNRASAATHPLPTQGPSVL